MMVLVTYDIPDNQRRVKLATFLEGYGRRVQKSEFECFVNLAEMKKLCAQIEKRIRLPDDDVRLYWISADALPRSVALGGVPPMPPPSAYII